jgi:hypothetical protein
MTSYELVAASIALGAISVPIVTWAVLWLIRRDKMFANLRPGEVPADLDEAPTRYVPRKSATWDEVVARSTPPVGVSPGLGGVLIDGSADGRDISAMILDLTHRGWLQLNQISGTGGADGDWAITRVDQPLDATLDLNEVQLVTNIAPRGGTASLSELCSASDHRLALVQLDLHREVVARGWFPVAPHQTSDIPMAVLGVGGLVGLVIPLIDVSSVSIGAGAVILACAFLTSLVVRGGTPRTALGTAVRIQTLGLRRYLDEAQSYHFPYAQALETFRTYLPWAVVFGLENKWADLFATLGVPAQTPELIFARDLSWFANIRDHTRALPPVAPMVEVPAPRRGAYSEEDIVATVLISPDALAAGKLSLASTAAATVPAPRRSFETSPEMTAHDPAPITSSPRSTLGVASRTGAGTGPGRRRKPAPVAPLWRRRETDDQDPRPPAGSAEIPPTGVSMSEEAATPVPPTATPDATIEEPRFESPTIVHWMSELDLAMTGDVEDEEYDDSYGGTVIGGPERFDVLLTPPLWPDVPSGRATPHTGRADLPQ